MQDQDQNSIKQAVRAALDEYHGMNADEHRAHHQFIQRLLEREMHAQDRREKIKSQVGGWAVISLLSGIGYAVWNAFQTLIHHGGK